MTSHLSDFVKSYFRDDFDKQGVTHMNGIPMYIILPNKISELHT